MFHADECTLCGDCFVDCHWMDVDRDTAIRYMEEITNGEPSEVLNKCLTCYACNERCPQQANPFDRIAELQNKYFSLYSEKAIDELEQKFLFNGELRSYPKADRIMSLCVMEKTHAKYIQGELYDLPRVSGKPYFCWILADHVGAESLMKKHAGTLVDRLAMTGAKEVVCFHDDCYTMLARQVEECGIKPPFRPVHFTEYLVEYLKENKDRVKPLNINVAYSRPCASRLTPWKENYVDELFEIAGVNRVARTYDRDFAMCCGGAPTLLTGMDQSAKQRINLQDAKDAGADAVVCLCPVCISTLSATAEEMSLPLIFIGDIARMALGEIEVNP